MVLADTHCHLGMYADPEAVVARAGAAGAGIVVATSRATEYRGLRHLVRPGVDLGLGMHPECAGSVYVPFELAIFAQEVASARWISEVGLDGVIDRCVSPCFGAVPDLNHQRELFDAVLDLAGPARAYSVHSRAAAAPTITMLRLHGCHRVVLHGFDGSPADARRAADAGFYFSVHPSMLQSPAGLALIRGLPRELLLVETDGPFYGWSGTHIEPAHCPGIVAALAEARNEPSQALEDQIAINLTALMTGSDRAQ